MEETPQKLTPEDIERIAQIVVNYIETHLSAILEEYYRKKELELLERARKVEEELKALREKDLAEIEALKKRYESPQGDK